MNSLKLLRGVAEAVFPRRIRDAERNSIVIVQYTIALATLAGSLLDLIFHASSEGSRLLLPLSFVCLVSIISLVLIRREALTWSGSLLFWTLLGFVVYLLWSYDGIHDTAILAVPAVLTGAALIFSRKHFLIFASITFISVGIICVAQIRGLLPNAPSIAIRPTDVADLLIILALTTLAIQLISDGFHRSLERTRSDSEKIRKQAETLTLSEKRYRTLFEGANDAILILRDEVYTECNTTAMKMFNSGDQSDIVGRSPWELSPDKQPDGMNSKDKALAIIRDARRGAPQRFYWKHKRVDGTQFDAEVSLSQLELPSGVFIQAIVRDVTESKQFEDRIRESEEYYRKLVETSPDAIIIVDETGKLSFASQKAYEMLNVPRTMPAKGLSVLQWIPAAGHDLVMKRVRDFFTDRLKSNVGEYKLLRQDGSPFWCEIASSPLLDENGAVKEILIVCRDVSDRKNASSALRESEDRFARLSDAAFEGIALSEKGHIIDLNEQLAAMLGYTRSEMIGHEAIEYVAPSSLQLVHERMILGDEEPYEHFALRKDGSVFPVEVRAKSIPYHGQKIRVTAIRDVTERKRAEESLRASEHQYRILFEGANDAMFIFDPSTEIILEANSKACELYGFTHEELVGLSLKTITLDIPRGESEIRKALGTGSLKNFETIHFRKDGTAVYILANASLIDYRGGKAMLSINHDITDRKRVDEVLRLQSAALQTAANAIVITDRNGEIIFVNSAFSILTGYSAEEVIGKNPKILKSGRQIPDFYAKLWETINGGNIWKGELVNKRKDGSFYTEEMTIAPVRDESGRLTNFVAIKQDITDRKQLQEQVLQSQKLDSIGQLAGGVAHDYNNILSVIIGYAHLLGTHMNADRDNKRAIESILTAANRGADLTKQLLAFARKEIISPKIININSSIESVEKMLQRFIGENIQLVSIPGKNLKNVKIDPTQFDQVLVNLAANSRDAIKGVGTVRIETSNVSIDKTEPETHPGLTTGDFVRLSFADTGVGMDAETLKKIFEPFFTTKERGHGTGLGLSTVYGIVSQNNGKIFVASKPGEGTSIEIFFPASAEEKQQVVTAEPEIISHGNETILVVEDEPDMLELTRTSLEKYGYKVLVAAEPIEALQRFREYFGKIQLVITDVIMPAMSGRKFIDEVRKLKPGMKTIYMSGYTANELDPEGVLKENVEFIQKPFTPTDLAKKVRHVLGS